MLNCSKLRYHQKLIIQCFAWQNYVTTNICAFGVLDFEITFFPAGKMKKYAWWSRVSDSHFILICQNEKHYQQVREILLICPSGFTEAPRWGLNSNVNQAKTQMNVMNISQISSLKCTNGCRIFGNREHVNEFVLIECIFTIRSSETNHEFCFKYYLYSCCI